MGCEHCFTEHEAGAACTRDDFAGEALAGMGYGPLVLVRKLGTGALASVYLAEHRATGAHFAVKVLHPHLARLPAVLQRSLIHI